MHVAINFHLRTAFVASYRYWWLCFYFIYFEIIFLISSFTHWWFKSVFSFNIFVDFQTFLLLSISSFFPMLSENIIFTISVFLNLLRLILCPVITILENVPSVLVANVHFIAIGWNVLYMPVKSIWSKVCFNSNVFLLVFCLDDVFIVKSWVVKPHIIIVLLFICPFQSVSICLINLGALLLGGYNNILPYIMNPLLW